MRSRKKKGLWFILPSLAGVSIFYLIPFCDVVRRSFARSMGVGFAGLDNYRKVLTNSAFLLAAKNTLRFVAVCLPLLLLLSLLLALLLQRRVWGRHVMKSTYLLPMAIPAASVVLLWRLLFDRQGMLNGLLERLNMTGVDWMNTGMAFVVLIFTYLWKNLGYDIILWSAGLSGISESIYDAARVDGAGRWQNFWYITLPNLKQVGAAIVVLSFLNSFKVFREAYLVAGNYPQEDIYLLQHVFNNWFRDLSVDKMAAGSCLLSGIVLGLVILLQKSWGKEDW